MASNSPVGTGPGSISSEELGELRWYAGQALQAIISHQGVPKSESAREEIALWAIRMAQAMKRVEEKLHIGDRQAQ